jgi:hypothetical protein
MKLAPFVRRATVAVRLGARAIGASLLLAAKTLLAPIGFRELLLFGGAALVGYGASDVYPPAAYLAPGLVFVGVAVFGVRA